MVGRRRAATAFRPSAPSGPSRAPSRRQTVALLTAVLAVAVALTVASVVVHPSTARSFDLFYGSVFVDDDVSPVAIDLSSGKPTVRLTNAQSAVSATRTQDLDVVPLDGGTLMLDAASGEFNMLDSSGFVIKPTGGGVRLPQLQGSAGNRTIAVAAGPSAYLVRSGTHGTAVYLVGQSTVASAVGVTSGVKARAAAVLSVPSASDAATAASANGDLWLVTGSPGGARQIVQFHLPAGSNAGATLTVRRHGAVNGVAAVASAPVATSAAVGDAVAIASATAVRVLSPDGTSRSTPVAVRGQVQSITPIRGAQGKLSFLYRSSQAWTLVRIGAASGVAHVSPVDGIGADTPLITPVESNGAVYTLAQDSIGSIYRIDSDGHASTVAGAARYPLVRHEALDLTGAEVTADGSRVIVDARADLQSVVLFTDGSHQPRVIDKHSAVQVDTNGAASITGDQQKHQPSQQKSTKPQPHPEQAVDNKLNCKVVSQTPHIPSVQLVQRASRSVQLQWTYPLLEPQDCYPSTYTVAVRSLSVDAPPAPAMVTVQGATSLLLTGLFPDTKYEIVLTAYINTRHTSAPPLDVATSVEGPAAPTAVHTSVDNDGNWTITWDSCGGVQSGCVPTADWQIVPHLCDGVGVSANPDTRRQVGDPTQHTFSFTYTGGDALLGRGLSFDIQGIGVKGTIGDSASDNSCSYSWRPPTAADITVHASSPPVAASGAATTHTDVSVDFVNQTHDLGGVGGELTYQLLHNGDVVSTLGPTTKTSVQIAGISPGTTYQVAVVVNPPRHRDVTANVPPVDVDPAKALWPQPSVAASLDDTTGYAGTLHVTVSLPPGTDNHGETFDLSSDSRLVCGGGNDTLVLSRNNVPFGQAMNFDVDRTQYFGPCRVSIALVQDTVTDPPLYGDGTTSPGASETLTIDPPTLQGVDDSSFSATWSSSTDPAHPQVIVSYNDNDLVLLGNARNWVQTVTNEGGTTTCGRTTDAWNALNRSSVVDIDRNCIKTGGPFTATVEFDFFGNHHAFTVPVSGTAPEPVDPTKMGFTAEWQTGLPIITKPAVLLHFQNNGNFSQADLDALKWKETVTSDQSPGVICGVAGRPPDVNGNGLTEGDATINIIFQSCPTTVNGTTATYTLHVTYTDPNYGTTPNFPDVPVTGSP